MSSEDDTFRSGAQRFARNHGNDAGVCEKNIPPKKNTIRKIGFRSTKSGAG